MCLQLSKQSLRCQICKEVPVCVCHAGEAAPTQDDSHAIAASLSKAARGSSTAKHTISESPSSVVCPMLCCLRSCLLSPSYPHVYLACQWAWSCVPLVVILCFLPMLIGINIKASMGIGQSLGIGQTFVCMVLLLIAPQVLLVFSSQAQCKLVVMVQHWSASTLVPLEWLMTATNIAVAMQLLPVAAKSPSAVRHGQLNGAQMSGELPSLHDWGQPSNPTSTAAPAAGIAAAVPAATAASEEVDTLKNQAGLLFPPKTAASHVLSQPSSHLLPAEVPGQLPSGELLFEGQREQDADSQEPDGAPLQQPIFTIPFSGQSGLFAEEEDDLFGAVGGQQPGPFGATGGSLGTEPSFAFEDLSAQQDELQSQPTPNAFVDDANARVAEVSTAAGLYDAYAQQADGIQNLGWQNNMAEPAQPQLAGTSPYEAASEAAAMQAHGQLPDQATALWPQQQAQTSASLQAQSHSLFNPQSQSLLYSQEPAHSLQSHSQSLFQPHMQFQSQLPFQSQAQSQFPPQSGLSPLQPRLPSQSQSLFQSSSQSPFQPQSQLQSQAGPFRPVQQSLPSHGQQHMGPQIFRPGGASQGLPLTSFGQPPSAASAPFQAAFQPVPPPQSTASSLPFQAAFQPPAPPPSVLPPVPNQSACQHPSPQAEAQSQPAFQLPGGPLAVSTQRVSSPYAVESNIHYQQGVSEDDFWASQDGGTAPPESSGLAHANTPQGDAGNQA